jgi:hypothetical protein
LGTLPQALSAALCRAALIFCGTSSLALKYYPRPRFTEPS